MFTGFDPSLLLDRDFKEDSVREVIIAPMLARLGYTPSGPNRIIRSKSLAHPFIYVGTRKHPVTIVPDYTLLSGEKTLLVLDAKRPTESIRSRDNVQQAYSYAIHPEVKSEHFALCNGKELAVFNIDSNDPILAIPLEQFEARWQDIERHLGPRFLLEPRLRNFAPDFGSALARMGISEGTQLTMFGVQLNHFGRINDELMTTSSNCNLGDGPFCASFDFHPRLLPEILAGLPGPLRANFLNALNCAPFRAAAELLVEVDLELKLGEETAGAEEVFTPLIVRKVLASRFNVSAMAMEPAQDIDGSTYRLRTSIKMFAPGVGGKPNLSNSG